MVILSYRNTVSQKIFEVTCGNFIAKVTEI